MHSYLSCEVESERAKDNDPCKVCTFSWAKNLKGNTFNVDECHCFTPPLWLADVRNVAWERTFLLLHTVSRSYNLEKCAEKESNLSLRAKLLLNISTKTNLPNSFKNLLNVSVAVEYEYDSLVTTVGSGILHMRCNYQIFFFNVTPFRTTGVYLN